VTGESPVRSDPAIATPLVEARGVSIAFGGTLILEDVDLAVRPGEFVTVIGPNGSGKTTLIRAVLGLLAPTSGTVGRRDKLRIGYVPQRLHVDKTLPLTARRFLSLSAPATAGRLERVLDDVGAAHIADLPLQALSGGEMKRAMLARALLREPDFLALDEPTASMDVTGQADFYALIQSIRAWRNCGVLLVSHDLHMVMAATDHVLCLNHHVCCSGAPDAVSRHPEYLALFGPEVSVAMATYTHRHDHRHTVSGDPVAIAEPSRGKDDEGATRP